MKYGLPELNENMGKLPPLKQVLKSIEVLKKEQWPRWEDQSTVDRFKEYFQDKFTKHFNRAMFYLSTPQKDLNYKFYRVRPYNQIKDLTSTREYSYPPKEITGLSRANLPGHPVFYASGSPPIALMETIRNTAKGAKEGTYCLSLWTIKKQKEFIVTPFTFNVDQEDYMEMSETILRDRLPEIMHGSDSDDYPSFKAIMEFLSYSFVMDDEKKYSISSYIGHCHLYMENKLRTDFFIYPSIQAERRAVNIAINPETVDEYLEMKYLLITEVSDVDLSHNKLEFMNSSFGVCEGNNVVIKPVADSKGNLDPLYLEILDEFVPTL